MNKRSYLQRVELFFGKRYPKITIFIICSLLAYYFFRSELFPEFSDFLAGWGYIGVFFSGILFSFGFTTPFSIVSFLAMNPQNILLASLLGGFGALLSDLFIFRIIKTSFMDEFERLERTKVIKEFEKEVRFYFSNKLRNYLLFAFAGIVIASPLPDELGVSLLTGLAHISERNLAIISFIMNSLGIYFILSLAAI